MGLWSISWKQHQQASIHMNCEFKVLKQKQHRPASLLWGAWHLQSDRNQRLQWCKNSNNNNKERRINPAVRGLWCRKQLFVFTSDGDAICSVLFMTEWILVKHGRWRATASNIPHILVEKCSWNFNLKKLLVLKELNYLCVRVKLLDGLQRILAEGHGLLPSKSRKWNAVL